MFSYEDYIFIHNHCRNNYNKFYRTLDFIPQNKLFKYIERKDEDEVAMYFDYLDMARNEKYDLKNSFVAFPKDVKTAHDMMVEVVNERKKREKEEKLRKQVESYNELLEELKRFSFANGKYMIKIPATLREITDEGVTLHHCVGTYTKRVSEKETAILFIRKVDDPDTPFFTMEVRDNKVIQVHGYCNCKPQPDVDEFVEKFKKKVLNKLKAKQNKISA